MAPAARGLEPCRRLLGARPAGGAAGHESGPAVPLVSRAAGEPGPWTPTGLTIDRCRELGYLPDLGLRRIRVTDGVLQMRAFGFIDVLAVREGEAGVLGIRAVWSDELEAEYEHLLGEARIAAWRAAGGRAEIWSWEPEQDDHGRMRCRVTPLLVSFACGAGGPA